MLFFKIFQAIIMPSTLIFLIFLVGVILYFKKWSRKATATLLIISIAGFYLLSISPIADLIAKPLTNKYQPITEQTELKADKIVILTGSLIDRASEALRLYYLNNLTVQQYNNITIIISGTSAINPADFSQADKMKLFLTERGVPIENIIMETESRDTFESAFNVENLVGQEPFYLVTSTYHMPRAMIAFSQTQAQPIPAPAMAEINRNYDFFNFVPSPDNLEKTNQSVHEYLGILYYKLRN